MKPTKLDLSTSLALAYGYAYSASIAKDDGDFDAMLKNIKAAKKNIDAIVKALEEPRCVVLLHPTVTQDVAAISALEELTRMTAVCEQGRATLLPITIINSRKEFEKLYKGSTK